MSEELGARLRSSRPDYLPDLIRPIGRSIQQSTAATLPASECAGCIAAATSAASGEPTTAAAHFSSPSPSPSAAAAASLATTAGLSPASESASRFTASARVSAPRLASTGESPSSLAPATSGGGQSNFSGGS